MYSLVVIDLNRGFIFEMTPLDLKTVCTFGCERAYERMQ